MQKNSVIPDGVVLRSFAKQETKKAFVFNNLQMMPPGKTEIFAYVFSKMKRKPGEKMPGNEVKTKTSQLLAICEQSKKNKNKSYTYTVLALTPSIVCEGVCGKGPK